MYAEGLDDIPPVSAFQGLDEDYDALESAERLHPSRLPRAASRPGSPKTLSPTSSSKLLTSRSSGALPRLGSHSSGGLQRSGSDVRDAVKTALKRTSSQISRSSSAGTKEFLSALGQAASGDFEAASAQVQTAREALWKNGLFFVARFLICIFFLDNCLTAYQNWQFYQTDMMRYRVQEYPHRYQDPGFPYFQLFLIVPVALLTMLGVSTRWTAMFLVMDMMRDGTGIILEGVQGAIQHKMALTEMSAKHLAMLGSSILILVHEFRSHSSGSSTAGSLLSDRSKPAGKVKSLFLLASRLFLTALFLTVGTSQAIRVIKRDYQWYEYRDYLRRDGHDNNFLLLEAVLAVPFALGYKTKRIAPILAVTLLAEAIFCWNPLEHWPSVQYQAHVRSHFATNMGSAGGLIMLGLSSGRFTIDKLMSKKD